MPPGLIHNFDYRQPAEAERSRTEHQGISTGWLPAHTRLHEQVLTAAAGCCSFCLDIAAAQLLPLATGDLILVASAVGVTAAALPLILLVAFFSKLLLLSPCLSLLDESALR